MIKKLITVVALAAFMLPAPQILLAKDAPAGGRATFDRYKQASKTYQADPTNDIKYQAFEKIAKELTAEYQIRKMQMKQGVKIKQTINKAWYDIAKADLNNARAARAARGKAVPKAKEIEQQTKVEILANASPEMRAEVTQNTPATEKVADVLATVNEVEKNLENAENVLASTSSPAVKEQQVEAINKGLETLKKEEKKAETAVSTAAPGSTDKKDAEEGAKVVTEKVEELTKEAEKVITEATGLELPPPVVEETTSVQLPPPLDVTKLPKPITPEAASLSAKLARIKDFQAYINKYKKETFEFLSSDKKLQIESDINTAVADALYTVGLTVGKDTTELANNIWMYLEDALNLLGKNKNIFVTKKRAIIDAMNELYNKYKFGTGWFTGPKYKKLEYKDYISEEATKTKPKKSQEEIDLKRASDYLDAIKIQTLKDLSETSKEVITPTTPKAQEQEIESAKKQLEQALNQALEYGDLYIIVTPTDKQDPAKAAVYYTLFENILNNVVATPDRRTSGNLEIKRRLVNLLNVYLKKYPTWSTKVTGYFKFENYSPSKAVVPGKPSTQTTTSTPATGGAVKNYSTMSKEEVEQAFADLKNDPVMDEDASQANKDAAKKLAANYEAAIKAGEDKKAEPIKINAAKQKLKDLREYYKEIGIDL
ncbi:MAG: hypothetical protein WC707_04485 [Candidatus Babeliaceae bacterium]|jgi:hypothetical protein